MQYNTIQCSRVQYNGVQCSAVRYSAAPYCIPYIVSQCLCTVLYCSCSLLAHHRFFATFKEVGGNVSSQRYLQHLLQPYASQSAQQ